MPIDAYAWAKRIIDTCWIVFTIFWFIAAFSTKRTVYREPLGTRAIWFALLITAYLVVVKGHRIAPLNASFLPHVPATAIAAALVCALGLLFTLWARVILGRNWSGRVTLKEDHELIERGPYRYVRHPIYTGLLTMALGTALLSGRVAALLGCALFLAALLIKMGQEETLLLRQFPAEYAAYRRRTKRIIPFVW
jgi:protein-S-isoprenylcysteine O-methyltransferase Ste14